MVKVRSSFFPNSRYTSPRIQICPQEKIFSNDVCKYSILCFSRWRAKSFFSAMRAFENPVIVHMNRKGSISQLGIEGLIAFRADIFLRCNMLSRSKPCNSNNGYGRNDDYPPRNRKLLIQPIHLTCCQGKRHDTHNTKEND